MHMSKSVVPLSPAVQPAGLGTAQAESGAEPAGRAQASESTARPAVHSRAAPAPGAFVPVLLASLALVGWLGFQTLQAYGERVALQNVLVGQQKTVDTAMQLRASLDALAADTQRLADAGNPNAGLLVTELRKRGITINVSAGAAPAPAAAASH